jgi:hypothetical protein
MVGNVVCGAYKFVECEDQVARRRRESGAMPPESFHRGMSCRSEIHWSLIAKAPARGPSKARLPRVLICESSECHVHERDPGRRGPIKRREMVKPQVG